MLATRNLWAGLTLPLTLALAALFERGIKTALRRPRPFTCQPNTHVLQPRRPKDASFPSGDALRVWFLINALIAALSLSGYPALALYGIATLVTVGRVALGVHYPLDALAGAGLGILSAGVWSTLYL